jgi:hypothetical protein
MNLYEDKLYGEILCDNKIITTNPPSFKYEDNLYGSSIYGDFDFSGKLYDKLLHGGVTYGSFLGEAIAAGVFLSTVATYGVFKGESLSSADLNETLLNYNEIPYLFWDEKDLIYLGWD